MSRRKETIISELENSTRYKDIEEALKELLGGKCNKKYT